MLKNEMFDFGLHIERLMSHLAENEKLYTTEPLSDIT